MDQKAFARLLLQLLLVPVLSLALFAVILVFALNQVRIGSQSVERADTVINHANLLVRLIIDEETGLRGFLVTHDRLFLEPYLRAQSAIPQEFATLHSLVRRDSHQEQRLADLESGHHTWEGMAAAEIQSPATAAIRDRMLERKAAMDIMRALSDTFIRSEEQFREDRLAWALRLNRLTRIGLIALVFLIAGIITLITRRVFRRVSSVYDEQIAEARTHGREALEREQWLNTTLRSIGDAVIACHPDGTISFINAVAEKLTGWPEAEAVGRPLPEVFHIVNEHTRNIVESPVDKVRRLGIVVGLANHTALIRRDGSEVSIDDSGAPIRDPEGNLIGIVLVFRDITERKLTENAIMRAEKLAAAGRLAASIAHEVNNPLEGLMNLVYIARNSDSPDEIKRLLAQADSELHRISHITRQSLGFYREGTRPALYSPADVLREVTTFYQPRAKSRGIQLDIDVRSEVQILGLSGEFRQIISNLLANAIDAGQPTGSILLRITRGFDTHDPSLGGVRVTVADNGSGILPATLTRIFDPFFTTKAETGTGLGLWVTKELIEKHGGRIRVRSRAFDHSNGHRNDAGTVFSFFLPLMPPGERTVEAVMG